LESPERTDEQLALAAAREDSAGPGFVELMARYRERVWRICYRLMGNEQDALDAAQEVFVRLFIGRQRYRGVSRYSTWVYGVAVRTCLSMRRSRGRRLRRVRPASEDVLQAQPAREGQQDPSLALELTELLEQLSEDDRAMLLLKYAENYQYEELAEMFGLSVSACKMRLSRARERIQKSVSPPIEAPSKP
jgi:RNA polymerase sigma-70 factor (ECF subfamily)